VAAQLPGQMGLDLWEERMRRKEIESGTFNSRKAYLDTFGVSIAGLINTEEF